MIRQEMPPSDKVRTHVRSEWVLMPDFAAGEGT